jgi:ribosomal protein L12E/L44/L45/RPP1/RPP2
MRKIKYLLSNINLMNIMLAVLLIFIVNYMAMPFSKMDAKYALPPVKKPAIEKTSKDEKTEEKSPSPSDYMVIAEQNLFHPERMIPVQKVEAPPLPQPEFMLYGTLVTDGLQIAYMEDKKTKGPQDKEKRQTALRLGDSMSGFVLKEVDNDEVVMQRGEEKLVISLNETKIREMPVAAAAPPQAASAAPHQAASALPLLKEKAAAPRRQRANPREVKSQQGKMGLGGGGSNAGPVRRRNFPTGSTTTN